MKPNGAKNNGKDQTANRSRSIESDIENFDWNRIIRRLHSLNGSSLYDDGSDLTEEQIEAAWAERARQMAQVMREDDTGDAIEVVLLKVGREMLGIPVEYVSAIRGYEPPTRVPRVPSWVAGVIHLRGTILSVINLRVYLNLPAAAQPVNEDHPNGLMVVSYAKEMEVVLLVDDVPGVEAVPVKLIQHEPKILRGIRPEYVRGIYQRIPGGSDSTREEPVIILNLEDLLTDRRIIIYDEPV